MRPPFREKRTWWLLGSKTKAPLLPTLRKSLPSPVASLARETAVCGGGCPWAIGVRKALSGPCGRACAEAGAASTAAASATAITPLCLSMNIMKQPRRDKVALPSWLTSPRRCHTPLSHGESRPVRRPRRQAQQQFQREATPRSGRQDCLGSRRRWVHRRRLRDGSAARLRPAGGQPHRQRLRHLRRHQRRRLRGEHGRQRRHARGDVPRPRQGAALADRERVAADPAAPQLPGLRQPAGAAAPAGRGHRAQARQEHRRDLDGRRRHGPRRGPADRDLPQPRDRAVHPQRALRPRPHQRLPRARRRAADHGHRPRHVRADRARRGRVGRRPDLPRRRRLRRRCRSSTSPTSSGAAS